jgi:hypothetical protein
MCARSINDGGFRIRAPPVAHGPRRACIEACLKRLCTLGYSADDGDVALVSQLLDFVEPGACVERKRRIGLAGSVRGVRHRGRAPGAAGHRRPERRAAVGPSGRNTGGGAAGQQQPIILVAFGGSGAGCRALLASRERDGYVRLWDLDGARAPVAKMPGSSHKQAPVACGTGAGDRALLAEGDSDGTVRLWCPTDTRPGERLTLHTGPVTSVVFGSGAGFRRSWPPARL